MDALKYRSESQLDDLTSVKENVDYLSSKRRQLSIQKDVQLQKYRRSLDSMSVDFENETDVFCLLTNLFDTSEVTFFF